METIATCVTKLLEIGSIRWPCTIDSGVSAEIGRVGGSHAAGFFARRKDRSPATG